MTTRSDQASGLRRIAGGKPTASAALPCLPALAITGGKGGVGKTAIASNLSVLLHKMGISPLLIDLDMGLANADVILGVNPQTSLFEVLVGGQPLRSALCTTPQGFDFVPAASGREELTRLSHRQFDRLLQDLAQLAQDYQLLIFDTMAGISAEVITFLRASRLVVTVLTPDPTSLTDAYALIKVLEGQQPGKDIRVIVNQAGSDNEALRTFARLQKVVRAYLKRDVQLLGHIPRDRQVTESVRSRSPFACHPQALASQALRGIALRLKGFEWHS
jgi:flagellar biosynthesis protein FlhG